ncbi:MAG TPA: pseudaminic acid biosynthesis-associated methylase [Bacteroidia bacterium]|jgi:pseudaminic acid biosynthesis-associated methylase|nr:pseudaminic acid biosynthesis-associated methylase [Bacteroidia bacterium]
MNEQQKFWAENYAREYIEKNKHFDAKLGIKGWEAMLSKTGDIDSILECGCNIGRNINFLNSVLPKAKKSIIEISVPAYKYVTSNYSLDESFNGPIADSEFKNDSFNLTFTVGVLIHISPDDLLINMKKLFDYSNKYILIAEYFNRTPVMIEYQGQQNKLFKRDFGKLFLENFNAEIIDYGFLWGHIYDKAGFDDITWWLFEKK